MAAKKSKKLTHKEKREAEIAAYRKARMQWYVLGGLLALAVVAAIVLISMYTEGSLPYDTQAG